MKETPQKIEYPFLPHGRDIEYVADDNPHMLRAREVAKQLSKDDVVPVGVVIVKDGKVIGEGANGSDWHDNNECVRVKMNIPSGQGYELCEGCSPKNHGEPSAIADAAEKGHDTDGADMYLWGHWWCCEPCWSAMDDAGIKSVYLLEGSQDLFNKDSPSNIIGKQFEA